MAKPPQKINVLYAMRKRLEKIAQNPWVKLSTNKFTLATLGFIIWMLFLDVNSLLIHYELNSDQAELKRSIEYYEHEIAKDKKQLEELTSDPEMLEKFAREQYWMKRPGEDIFLIEAE